MYLTRFRINPARRGARRLLASPHVMHAAVYASFAEVPSVDEPLRPLWRLDHRDNGDAVLYIVSRTATDLTHLVEQAGWPTLESWQCRPYGEFLSSLTRGQRWAFRLTANPVRSGRRDDSPKQTRRFGHVTVEQQTGWLLDRAQTRGFTIVDGASGEPNLLVHSRSTAAFSRGRGAPPVTLRTATYDGVLEVLDPDALRDTMTNGLGHAKAYGCGLLTLAPIG